MQDLAQFVQLAQILCYDLARAEKATDINISRTFCHLSRSPSGHFSRPLGASCSARAWSPSGRRVGGDSDEVVLSRGVSWCLESVMLWRGIIGLTKFGDKHVNDLDLL